MFYVQYNHNHETSYVSKACNLDSLTFGMEEDSSFRFDIIFSKSIFSARWCDLMVKQIVCGGFEGEDD